MTPNRSQSGWRLFESVFNLGALGTLSDGELLECFQTSGGTAAHEAFRILVERHGPMVLGLCRSVVRNPHDADDAFQATFLVLVRKAGSIKRRDTIAPWLHGVASRVARRARGRSLRRMKSEVEATAEIAGPDRPIGESPSVEQIVHDEIALLPERFRSPVVLCCLEGLSYDLAARRLGLAESTLRGRLHRARKQLAARLNGRGIITGTFASISEPISLTAPVLPSSLVESTVKFSIRWSSVAGLLPAAAVPDTIAGLAQGVIKSMLLQSLKLSSVVVLAAAGTLATVALAQQGKNVGAGNQPQVSAKQVTSREDRSESRKAQQPAKRPPVTAEQLVDRLGRPIDASFPDGTTLENFLKHIKRQTTDAEFSGIPIYVSPFGLQEVEVGMSTKVFVDMKQRPVREVLEAALRKLNLTQSVTDGFLMIDSHGGYRIRALEHRVEVIDRKLDRVLDALERLEKIK